MIRFLCKLIVSLSCLSGSLICKEVHQSPANVLCSPKKTVILSCNHSISSYDTILWYQRARGNTSLKLIGFMRMTTLRTIEPEYEGHFNVSGNGQSFVSLHILQARQVEDSAMYFCAAYEAQCYILPLAKTKTQL
ncbi:hypothetical protein AOLI_G00119980 [Acnodon oligacanthus]